MSKDRTRKTHIDTDERYEQKTVHSFFIRTILKEQWDLLENKNNQGWNQYKKLFIQVLKTEMCCN